MTDPDSEACVHGILTYRSMAGERIHVGTGHPCYPALPLQDAQEVEADTAQMPRVDDNNSKPQSLADFIPVNARGMSFHFPDTEVMHLAPPPPLQPVFGFHDESGRSLIEFRIVNGVLEAKYYPSDLDDAAQKFVAYLREHYSG